MIKPLFLGVAVFFFLFKKGQKRDNDVKLVCLV